MKLNSKKDFPQKAWHKIKDATTLLAILINVYNIYQDLHFQQKCSMGIIVAVKINSKEQIWNFHNHSKHKDLDNYIPQIFIIKIVSKHNSLKTYKNHVNMVSNMPPKIE